MKPSGQMMELERRRFWENAFLVALGRQPCNVVPFGEKLGMVVDVSTRDAAMQADKAVEIWREQWFRRNDAG